MNLAQQAWQALRDDPTLHPADVLAAIVWPQDERLKLGCELCGELIHAHGLCVRHYHQQYKKRRRGAIRLDGGGRRSRLRAG